jgi:DNA-binding response OmpR family regulator
MSTRILYAEDDEATRSIVSAQLTEEGFLVEAAEDGTSALRALDGPPFDLVLLDIRMPGASGLDVLREIKKRELKVRIIMLTAVNELSIAIEAVKLGANDYITKPYSLEELLGAIRRILRR